MLLEYPIDAANDKVEEYLFRYRRFSRTYTVLYPSLPNPSLPFTMADSGAYIHTSYEGSVSAQTAAYRAMIEPEWARPPEAQITAYWERVGNHFYFYVNITNLSSTRFSKLNNDAEVTALIYEDVTADPLNPPANYDTNRYVRRIVHQPLTTVLDSGKTIHLDITTPDMVGQYATPLDWNKLHGLVFIDYRTAYGTYDMLQAALAQTATEAQQISVDRSQLLFLQDRSKPTNPTEQISVTGFPSTLTWTASSNKAWLKVTPTSGDLHTQITASLDISTLSTGTYDGQITVAGNSTNPVQQVVPVHLVVTDSVSYVWLPLIGGPLPIQDP